VKTVVALEPEFAGHYRPNGFEQHLGRDVLIEDATHAQAQSGRHLRPVDEVAQQNDPAARGKRHERIQDITIRQPRQRHIEEQHRRLELAQEPQHFRSIRRFTCYLKPRLVIEKLPEPGPKQMMIVCEDDAEDRLAFTHWSTSGVDLFSLRPIPDDQI
jgi:hypothetical protein